jgi:hypothetical protein
MLLSEICCLVSVGRPLWREDGSAICSAITQWFQSRRTRNHTLLSHLRLYQPAGPGSLIYIPQNVAQLYPRALSSLYLVSYDSQGYSGGILTLHQPGGPGPRTYISFRNRMVQSKAKVKSQSHVTTDAQSISTFLCLVHEALEEFYPNEFQSYIKRGTLRQNCLCYHWEGCMWSMLCNVEFGYQLSICLGPRKTLIQLAGPRTLRMQTDF